MSKLLLVWLYGRFVFLDGANAADADKLVSNANILMKFISYCCVGSSDTIEIED